METPIQILIVEDEFITQRTIANQLEEMGYEIAGLAMSSEEAIAILNSKKVNFAILDINIQGGNDGIWLANFIKEKHNIPFIYLTAYADDDTIKRAITTEPFSYLVKPFQKHDLLTAIEISILNFNKLHPKKEATLLLKHNEIFKKVSIASIIYIESDKNYLKLFCEDEVYRYRSTISDFMELLPNYFYQTHKGFIVNSNFITGFNHSFVEINEIQIPISKTYKEKIMQLLGN